MGWRKQTKAQVLADERDRLMRAQAYIRDDVHGDIFRRRNRARIRVINKLLKEKSESLSVPHKKVHSK
jgi:hypothetical protein